MEYSEYCELRRIRGNYRPTRRSITEVVLKRHLDFNECVERAKAANSVMIMMPVYEYSEDVERSIQEILKSHSLYVRSLTEPRRYVRITHPKFVFQLSKRNYPPVLYVFPIEIERQEAICLIEEECLNRAIPLKAPQTCMSVLWYTLVNTVRSIRVHQQHTSTTNGGGVVY